MFSILLDKKIQSNLRLKVLIHVFDKHFLKIVAKQ